MRRPIVRTMAHPPTTVPAVRTRPVAPRAHNGIERASARPDASSRAAMMPVALAASFEPLANAMRRRGHPLAAADRPLDPPGRPAQAEPQRPVDQEADPEPEHRGDRERQQEPERADRLPPVEPAPVDGLPAALQHRGPDEAADQRVPGARRDPELPRHRVPHGGAR